jgi:hypothetical protein
MNWEKLIELSDEQLEQECKRNFYINLHDALYEVYKYVFDNYEDDENLNDLLKKVGFFDGYDFAIHEEIDTRSRIKIQIEDILK